MKTKSTLLTEEERDILILAALHGHHLSNTEIALSLGISVSRVKTLIHQACVKLGAHNRNEAIFVAIMKRREIIGTEVYSLDELAEILCSLGPDMLRRIAHLVRQELEQGQPPAKAEQIISMERRPDTTLTKRERDVLIFAGRGLTNKEIADRLCISISAVRTFLNRACTKLGAPKRADAIVLALKRREINIGEIFSFDELLQTLALLGVESIEKIAKLLDQKLGQKPISTGN